MRYVDDYEEVIHDWKVRCVIWCLIGLVAGIGLGIWATQDQMEARYMATIDKFYITYNEQSRQWHALFPGHEIRKQVGKKGGS
jgi:hypothetical protein